MKTSVLLTFWPRLFAAFALLVTVVRAADLSLPAIFGNHMVLQQNVLVPVWGNATPGVTVTVLFSGQSHSATADASGKWRVRLSPLRSDTRGKPFVVTAGAGKIEYADVVVGDVWLCSGQSNMEVPVRNAHNASVAMPAADHPELRLFIVPKSAAWSGQDDIGAELRSDQSKWVVCRPDAPALSGFSAVGYFFGLELLKAGHRPLGLIKSSYGSSPAQAWTSYEVLAANPALAHYAKEFDKLKAAAGRAKKLPDGGIPPPEKARAPVRDAAEKSAAPVEQLQKNPVMLFQGMIQPLRPFALKGAIWYQGESNGRTVDTANEYGVLFPALINDWRRRWGQGHFPFLFVQLSAYKFDTWPALRQSQTDTLLLPNTGMAVSYDAGERDTIHPRNKEVVGRRLALAARHVAYGEAVIHAGPNYQASERAGNRIIVRFDHAGTGLKIGAPPPIRLEQEQPVLAKALQGFEVAGSDGVFHSAQAQIVGETVAVWSVDVPQPVSVRYAWEAFPTGNLYNSGDLPAVPFSTAHRTKGKN